MLNFAIYISNHGFGHATRAVALIEELTKLGIYCHIRSSRPDFIFQNLNEHYCSKTDVAVDFGVKHTQNLVPDLEATKAALLHLFDNRTEIVAKEIDFLRKEAIDLVIADVPYLVAEAGLYAGVPVFAISNFDWAFIYDDLFKDDKSIIPILNTVRQLYSHVQHAFRLPFSSPKSMAAFPHIEKMGLLARKKQSYSDIRKAYGIDETKPIMICMFGGEGDLDFDIEKLCAAFEGFVFSIQANVKSPMHITVSRDSDFLDLIYNADIILTKPGYSTFAEAVQFGKYIIYQDRTNYPEETVLVEGLKNYPYKMKIDTMAMTTRQWKTVLRSVDLGDRRISAVFKNQNRKIAHSVVKRFVTMKYSIHDLQSVLDIGTNNLTYLIWDARTQTVVHKHHFTTGLAKGYVEGLLAHDSIKNTKAILKEVLDFNKELGISTHVIATSISREARNIDKLSGWLEKTYQLKYNIISERQEIDYNFAAIRSSIDGIEDFIGFDIGGGSTEFICCDNGKQTIGESLDIGLMKLINCYSDKALRIQTINKALEKLSISPSPPHRIIGIGLTMAYITLIVKKINKYDPSQVHGQTIRRTELMQLKASLELSDISEIQMYMVEPNSREILALSVEFVILILDKYGASEIIVCDYGISLGYIKWNEKKSKSRK